ncbi:MAG: hypothetical protein SGPRY_012597, partial [Prymnesium sp.]
MPFLSSQPMAARGPPTVLLAEPSHHIFGYLRESGVDGAEDTEDMSGRKEGGEVREQHVWQVYQHGREGREREERPS